MKTKSLFISLLLALGSAPFTFAQGSLEPPGPPAPMMKTLEQIEPRKPIESLPYNIVQPGSYYVTTNLTGLAGSNGITIATCCVTLDLGGFELAGVPSSGHGIYVAGTHTNISIRNGCLRNWGGSGVEAVNARNSMLWDLRASTNGSSGLRLGQSGLVRNCTSRANRFDGVYASTATSIHDCSADYNGRAGIFGGDNALVKDCATSNNGAEGIKVGDASSVKDCTSDNNGSYGIETIFACTVSGCVTRGSVIGIELGPGSIATGCTAEDNDGHGIRAYDGSQVLRCTASRNGTNGIVGVRPFAIATSGSAIMVVECTAEANADDGINLGSCGTVRSCVARNNGKDGIEVLLRSSVIDSVSCSNVVAGIRAGTGNIIRGCTAAQNRAEGIVVTNSCVVSGNMCETNNYGVRALGRGNRIEENHTASNITRGFKVDTTDGFNVVVKNSAYNRLGRAIDYNYEVAVGNLFGPVITGGSGAGGTLAAINPQNHPWANFGDAEIPF